MSTVQLKVWNVHHTMVKYISKSHHKDSLFRHGKEGMECHHTLVRYLVTSHLVVMQEMHDIMIWKVHHTIVKCINWIYMVKHAIAIANCYCFKLINLTVLSYIILFYHLSPLNHKWYIITNTYMFYSY